MHEVKETIGPQQGYDALVSQRRYRKILITAVVSVSVVAVLPLLLMTGLNYYQYQEAFDAEQTRPMVRFTANGKQSLESFLSERLSALAMVIRERSFEELRDAEKLDRLLVNMKQAFGGFVDLGVIDERGIQVSYAGPYELEGKSYREHDWFHEVSVRGVHISDVFLGYRNLPHFVVAAQKDPAVGHEFVLHATIDTEVINRLVRSLVTAIQPSGDAFIINSESVLQTPSRFYGAAMERAPLPALSYSTQVNLIEIEDESGKPLMVSYVQIERSPFTLVLLSPRGILQAGWVSLRRDLLGFLAISIVLILAVVLGGSTYMVNRAREADLKRAALYHKMEYTNKLAAIGRLGAGVAHEINNPLSIITEKGGLLKDLLTMSDELPPREKLVALVQSVLKAADRCGGITHRLLGFAKHMDVERENIDLDALLHEVLGFLEKEASYRNIRVDFNYPEEPPTIVSDRGQLQQIFLNIINNAFAAVEDGGHIEIGVERVGADAVAVKIADDGVGIPADQLTHIFDPFFTTKKGGGTGLGLSITYGIVQKLGGQIGVESRVGEGTCLTITLPIGQALA
ncbi:MAG: two-component sensor histidine kinase [Deltaproteobacteria bacterium]|nr:two-component sensor histidine kinase [Deltaproteobacteria bacterium]